MWEAWSETFQNLGVCLNLQRWGVNRKGEERSSNSKTKKLLNQRKCFWVPGAASRQEKSFSWMSSAKTVKPLQVICKISLSYGKFCVLRQDPPPPRACKSLLWWWHRALGQTVCPPCLSSQCHSSATTLLSIHQAQELLPGSSQPRKTPGLSLESRGELRGCSTQGLQTGSKRPNPSPQRDLMEQNFLVGKV